MWTGFDTYGTSLQPAVFGDTNNSSARDIDLYFVTGRERKERESKREGERKRNPAEEGLSHGKMCKGEGVVETEGGV